MVSDSGRVSQWAKALKGAAALIAPGDAGAVALELEVVVPVAAAGVAPEGVM